MRMLSTREAKQPIQVYWQLMNDSLDSNNIPSDPKVYRPNCLALLNVKT